MSSSTRAFGVWLAGAALLLCVSSGCRAVVEVDNPVDDPGGDPGGPGVNPGDPGGDVVPGSVAPGGSCRCDSECRPVEGNDGLCVYGICMIRPWADCSAMGSQNECPAGSRCWPLGDFAVSICWPDCGANDCVGDCNENGSCVPNDATVGSCDPDCAPICPARAPDDGPGDDPIDPPPPDGTIGSPCTNDGDCGGATCYQDAEGGWIFGYCLDFGCGAEGSSCGDGGICISGLTSDGTNVCMQDCATTCRAGYECLAARDGGPGFCYPSCGAPSDCPGGYTCQDGVCIEHCEGPSDCASGQECVDGRCVTDIGDGPGPGTVPACTDLPPMDCTGGSTYCGELIQFNPTNSPANTDFDGIPYDPMLGYIDYPENGETWSNQYRSWLRRDAVMLIQYAAAYAACRAQDWAFGNSGGVGLIDMSEEDGRIPGTSVGSPGHPDGTHTNGRDIDLAYFQVDTPDNAARPVCDHTEGGGEAYHCTSDPYLLDPWRTALFVGALAHSSHLRVIGMDGRVGPLVESAVATLCADGWLDGTACTRGVPIAYETTDSGYGWYYFHHHHMHVSYTP